MFALALLFSDSSHSSTLGLGRHLWTPPDGKAFRPFPLPVRVRRPYLDMQAFLRGSAGGRVRASVCVCANEANRKPAVASVVELGQQRHVDKSQAPTRMS